MARGGGFRYVPTRLVCLCAASRVPSITYMKKKILIAATVVLVGCATRSYMKLALPSTPKLSISHLTFTNVQMQVAGIAPEYVTNRSGTNFPLTGVVMLQAFPTEAWQLAWKTETNKQYTLQYSTNLTNWSDIQVRFIGDGATNYWLEDSTPDIRFYKLKL
jgi:hypothetical protein